MFNSSCCSKLLDIRVAGTKAGRARFQLEINLPCYSATLCCGLVPARVKDGRHFVAPAAGAKHNAETRHSKMAHAATVRTRIILPTCAIFEWRVSTLRLALLLEQRSAVQTSCFFDTGMSLQQVLRGAVQTSCFYDTCAKLAPACAGYAIMLRICRVLHHSQRSRAFPVEARVAWRSLFYIPGQADFRDKKCSCVHLVQTCTGGLTLQKIFAHRSYNYGHASILCLPLFTLHCESTAAVSTYIYIGSASGICSPGRKTCRFSHAFPLLP